MNMKKMAAIRYFVLSDKDKQLVRAELSDDQLRVLDLLVAEYTNSVMGRKSLCVDLVQDVVSEVGASTSTDRTGWAKFVARDVLSENTYPSGLRALIHEVVCGSIKIENSYEH